MEAFFPRLISGLLLLSFVQLALSWGGPEADVNYYPEQIDIHDIASIYKQSKKEAENPIFRNHVGEEIGVAPMRVNDLLLETRKNMTEYLRYCDTKYRKMGGEDDTIRNKATRDAVNNNIKNCLAWQISCHVYECRFLKDSATRIGLLRAAYVLSYGTKYNMCAGQNITNCIISHTFDLDDTETICGRKDVLGYIPNLGAWSSFYKRLLQHQRKLSNKAQKKIDLKYLKALCPPCRTEPGRCNDKYEEQCEKHVNHSDDHDYNQLPNHPLFANKKGLRSKSMLDYCVHYHPGVDHETIPGVEHETKKSEKKVEQKDESKKSEKKGEKKDDTKKSEKKGEKKDENKKSEKKVEKKDETKTSQKKVRRVIPGPIPE